MNLKSTLIDVTADNLSQYPQVICFINPKHESHHLKMEWLQQQFKLGLKIKLLFLEGQKRPVGFVEYIPGENCWRAVNANGYLFIHCLWTTGKKFQNQGLGKLLLDAVEADAAESNGVAVVTSDNSFMTTREIFLKNGYQLVAESGKDQLLVKSFKEAPLPAINDWEAQLRNYHGLHIVYSRQCPWVARFIDECQPILQAENLDVQFTEIKTPAEAQNAPSLYSVFNLIYNGKILADRYISTTRFKNIIKKDIR